jgi:hypothetical protein
MVREGLADGPREQCSLRVLRVLARFRFRSVMVLSFGWKCFQTVRSSGGRSAGAWRIVRVLPADGLFFEVRYWRFYSL